MEIPTYGNQQVKNAPVARVRYSAQASPESFGAGQARDIQDLGAAMGKAGDAYSEYKLRSQQRTNKAIVRDSLNSAREEMRQYMSGVYRRRGKDAITVETEAAQELQKIRGKYLEQLKDDQQRDFFTPSFDGLMQGHLDRAMAHQEEQRMEFERLTWDAENQNAIEDAVSARTDPKAIKDAEFTIVANTKASLYGAGEEITKKAVEDAVHNLHASVLSALTQDAPKAAQGYMTEHWDKFNPRVRDELKKDIDSQVAKAWVRDTAVILFNSGRSLPEQLEEVDKIKDVEKANALRNALVEMDDERQKVKKMKNRELYEGEFDKLFSDPVSYQVPLHLNATEQEKLYNMRKKLIEDNVASKGAGAKPATNWAHYEELMTMSDSDLAKADIPSYDLAPPEFKSLIKMQREARKDGGATRLRKPLQQLQDAIAGMPEFQVTKKKGKVDKKGQQAAIRRNKLISAFSNAINAMPEEQQTEDAINKLVYKDLLAPVTDSGVPGWPFDNKNYFKYELHDIEDAEEKQAMFEKNVPDSLKGLSNVEFDEQGKRYYVLGDGVRDVYDEYGRYIKSQRKAVK